MWENATKHDFHGAYRRAWCTSNRGQGYSLTVNQFSDILTISILSSLFNNDRSSIFDFWLR